MSEAHTIYVKGVPVGQPRTKATARGGHVRMYTPQDKIGPWRYAIARAYAAAPFKVSNACEVEATFCFPRPASHFGTGKNSKTLKASAPPVMISKPDIDNLLKAVFDELTRLGAWPDDAIVYNVTAWKMFESCDGGSGCLLSVRELNV